MRITFYILALVLLIFSSCNNEPSLQKYFVEHSEKKGFVNIDVSPSIINLDKTKLTENQKTALESFDKMNVLVYKTDAYNRAAYDIECKKVSQILKGKEFQELMKFRSGKDAASVSFVGDEDHINEFILFAKNKEKGFAVVRILGNDMNPNNIMNMISLLKSATIDMEQLKPLESLMK